MPRNVALEEAAADLGPWLTTLFKASGLSRRALAQAIGTERTNLTGWLEKSKGMTAQSLLLFLSAVNAHIDPAPPDNLPRALNAELADLNRKLDRLLGSRTPAGNGATARTDARSLAAKDLRAQALAEAELVVQLLRQIAQPELPLPERAPGEAQGEG